MEKIENAVVRPVIAPKDSIIVTDPKGSVQDATAAKLREAGYTVKVINV